MIRILGVRGWAVTVGLLLALGVPGGLWLGLRARRPATPGACRDEMRLQCEQGTVSCDPNQRIEIYPHYTCLLVKCLCRRAP